MGPYSDLCTTASQNLWFTSKLPRRLAALAIALVLLPASQIDLFAQQSPYYPGQQQPYPYSNQYESGQQYQDYDSGQQYQQPYDQAPPQPDQAQPQGLGPEQLQQLVAPIALNPDPLIALMLAASTYPQQVQDSDQWRQSQGDAPPEQIAYGANLQPWDPSVKALTAFPQVLAEMDRSIQWTAALGNAYYNQPQDVLQSIQVMRRRAQTVGNLQSTPQESVSYDQGNVQIMPVNPHVVYVPAYNPWTAYGQPIDPYPGFSLLGAIGSFFNSSVGSSAVQFGMGTVLSAFNGTPWGLLSWGLNWFSQNLLFNHSDYYSSSRSVADWGLRYGGPRAWMAPHRSLVAYNRGYGERYSRDYGRSRYTDNWRRGNYSRGYQASRYNESRNYGYGSGYRSSLYTRPRSPFASQNNRYNGWQQRSYNHGSMQYNRSGYGSGFVGRSQTGYENYRSYRAPSSTFDHGRFVQRPNAYGGSAFRDSSGRQSRSSGFHLFGSHHNSGSFGYGHGFKAPKAPKFHGGGHFGGGHHSFGGGHHGGGHHR